MSQRQPDFGSQHLSRGTDRVPADWSSSSVALPVDSLADEPLGRDAGPHSPFAAMLCSPHPFRVEVSGRAGAQPVRRCITHLLPVRPAYAGRTDLTSQGAPKRFSPGNPDEWAANALYRGVDVSMSVTGAKKGFLRPRTDTRARDPQARVSHRGLTLTPVTPSPYAGPLRIPN